MTAAGAKPWTFPAVVPYRLDADTVLDPEKAMKRRFTNDDAIEARKKVARWICELD